MRAGNSIILLSALLIAAPVTAQDWEWKGRVSAGQWLEIKGVNGDVRAVASSGLMNLHVLCHHGRNSHHIVEAVFKATARALRQAVEIERQRATLCEIAVRDAGEGLRYAPSDLHAHSEEQQHGRRQDRESVIIADREDQRPDRTGQQQVRIQPCLFFQMEKD